MNSKVAQQATWKTSDGSSWWLRSTLYSQPNGPEEWPDGRAKPNGDYQANCYMDLWRLPSNENTIQFNDQKCNYRSRSYYCQPVKPKPKPPPPPAPPPPVRKVPWSTLKEGVKEEIYYFKQGDKVPTSKEWPSNGPNMFRVVPQVKYAYINASKAWPGYTRSNNFAVRWSGFLICPTWDIGTRKYKLPGMYHFRLTVAGGANLYVDKQKVIDNDGSHGKLAKAGHKKYLSGQHFLKIEYFDKGLKGVHGVNLQWKCELWGRAWKTITKKHLRYQMRTGFKEEVFYITAKDRIPDLNKVKAANQRVVKEVHYTKTVAKWKHFTRAINFAVRWSGFLKISKGGIYRFSLNSDDGSRMFLNGKLAINNDGIHSWRKAESTMTMKKSTTYYIIVEYFQKDKEHGIAFRYMGADTDDKMSYVGVNEAVHVRYLPVKTPKNTWGNITNFVPKPKPKKKTLKDFQ